MKIKGILLSLIGLITVFALIGCSNAAGPAVDGDTTAPSVVSTMPADQATNVSINGAISAEFSEAMDHATIVAANFTVLKGDVPVSGTVSYDLPNMTARFAPTVILDNNAYYTATLTSSVADLEGNTMTESHSWTFTTALAGIGPDPVLLGTAGNFVILAKTAISTVPLSAITGDIGISPAAESFMTGFSQTKFTGYSTAPQVTGFMYAADMTPPTPVMMTTAISDMETAYSDAATRVTPGYLNTGAGEIGGMTLTAGLYKWTSSVTILSDLTISGGANDVWIFQITGDLSLGNGMQIFLEGGAQSKNIFWQLAGEAVIGTTAHFEGIMLSQTAITLNTGATMNGKALAQTQVALDQATVTDVE